MSRECILRKVQEIFVDVFGDENILIKEETDANDIDGWDSFMHITLLEVIQDEFGVKFEFDEIIDMKNVSDIIEAVYNKI